MRRKRCGLSCLNSTIDGNLASIDDLLAKNSLFADFKAVQNGNVWCIGKNLYQDTMDTGSIIHDFHEILNRLSADNFLLFHLQKLLRLQILQNQGQLRLYPVPDVLLL